MTDIKSEPSKANPNSLTIYVTVSNFNTSHLLPETLESIINQDHSNFSLTVVDAQSTDNFLKTITPYIHSISTLIIESDHGLYDGLCKSFALHDDPNGIYCYINAGDVYMPYAFSVVCEIFSRDHSINWLSGIPSTRNRNLHLLSTTRPLPYSSTFIRNGFHDGRLLPAIQQESCFWSYKLHQKINLNELSRLTLAGDFYLWSLFARTDSLFLANCVLASFTLHGNHLSRDAEGAYYSEQKRITSQPLLLYPAVLLYSLISRLIRLPDRIFSALPRVIDSQSN